jgi:hypothetical protein
MKASHMTRVGVVHVPILLMAACSPSDYADGIKSFSKAVTAADTMEQTIGASAQQAALTQWTLAAAKTPPTTISVDLGQCRTSPTAKDSAKCVVSWSGGAVPFAAETSSMQSLIKYAATLAAVVDDKTCTSLQSDAKDLDNVIADLAKDAKAPQLAAGIGPITTIVTTLGCLLIEHVQISILRQATTNADPIIQQLVPLIEHKNSLMFGVIINDSVRQLTRAQVTYNVSHQPADLGKMVALAAAVNKTKATPPGPVIDKIGTLHATLTQDLASHTVNLKRVQNDAQELIAAAQSVSSSIKALQTSGNISASTGESAAKPAS